MTGEAADGASGRIARTASEGDSQQFGILPPGLDSNLLIRRDILPPTALPGWPWMCLKNSVQPCLPAPSR